MSSLELKIPPDVVWVAVAGLMWLTSRVSAGLGAVESFRRPLALVLLVLGTGLIVAARFALNNAGTTWHPTEPGRTTALVTSGAYRFSRNPTYLGMEIVLLSWAVVLASPAAALVSALFVAYVGRFQIRPEESTLSALLGPDYRDYSQHVRRWL
jgi:protein-S-isoprenylcysteine O-methyltransferase Ste14